MAAIAIAAPRIRTAKDGVKTVLRVEGLALLVGALAFYAHLKLSWLLFGGLFLAPDLSFVFYLSGPKPGAIAYNAMHSTLGPIVVGAIGFWLMRGDIQGVAAIWLAHVGFDRALGYGLKYADAFTHTHLGTIGKRVANSE